MHRSALHRKTKVSFTILLTVALVWNTLLWIPLSVSALEPTEQNLQSQEGGAITQDIEGDGSDINIEGDGSGTGPAVQNVLMTLISNNAELQKRWKASWRLADTEGGTAATVTKAKVTYSDGSQVDRYFFNKTVKQVTGDVSPLIPFDATTKVGGYTYEGFNLVSFALAEGNKSTKIELYNGNTIESFDVPENAAQTGQGTNEWYQLLYRPIESFKKGEEKKEIKVNPDLEAALPFSVLNKPGDYITELKGIMLKALNDGKSDLEKFSSLKEYKLTISVPDLSAEDVKINDSWSNPERVNK